MCARACVPNLGGCTTYNESSKLCMYSNYRCSQLLLWELPKFGAGPLEQGSLKFGSTSCFVFFESSFFCKFPFETRENPDFVFPTLCCFVIVHRFSEIENGYVLRDQAIIPTKCHGYHAREARRSISWGYWDDSGMAIDIWWYWLSHCILSHC